MDKICPMMSCTFPNFRSDGLKTVRCLGSGCAWYIDELYKDSKGIKEITGCALSVLAKRETGIIYGTEG